MAQSEWRRQLWERIRVPVRIAGGVLLLVGGVAMLVLPGPGIAAIVAGVLLLAPNSRFSHWARRKGHELREWERRKLGQRRARRQARGNNRCGHGQSDDSPPQA